MIGGPHWKMTRGIFDRSAPPPPRADEIAPNAAASRLPPPGHIQLRSLSHWILVSSPSMKAVNVYLAGRVCSQLEAEEPFVGAPLLAEFEVVDVRALRSTFISFGLKENST